MRRPLFLGFFRFGLETGTAAITLASFGGVSQVKVFYGDYEVESCQIGETLEEYSYSSFFVSTVLKIKIMV